MKVELNRAEKAQKVILRQLLEFYCYDFSEYLFTDVNEQGLFNYRHLESYWSEPNRIAHFIMVNGKYAGFVLINKQFKIINDPSGHVISEFFVMRRYRRKGVGSIAAKLAARTPGGRLVEKIKLRERLINVSTISRPAAR